MKLSIMRHGLAEDEAESRVDADRALTTTGRDRVFSVAQCLRREAEIPTRVITSPLVRAVQTAEIVVYGTGLDGGSRVEVVRALVPGGDAVSFIERLTPKVTGHVMIVGHEPGLSGLASALLGSFSRAFDKAMVVGVELPDSGSLRGRSRLRFIVDPRDARLDRAA